MHYWTCGLLSIQKHSATISDWLNGYNVKARWLNESQLSALIGREFKDCEGVWMQAVSQISRIAFNEALRDYLTQHPKVEIIEDNSVKPRFGFNKILGIKLKEDNVVASAVVLSEDIDTDIWENVHLPAVQPILSHYFLFTVVSNPIKSIVVMQNEHILPILPDKILYCNTEILAYSNSVPPAFLWEEMYENAVKKFPVLVGATMISCWTDIQNGYDKHAVPAICESSRHKRLFYNYGNIDEIEYAPAAAKMVSDLLLEGSCEIDHRPYWLGDTG